MKKTMAPEYSVGGTAPELVIKIPGVFAFGDPSESLFTVTGLKVRDINWTLLAEAIGGNLTDDLMDKIGEVIVRADLVRILSERMTFGN